MQAHEDNGQDRILDSTGGKNTAHACTVLIHKDSQNNRIPIIF